MIHGAESSGHAARESLRRWDAAKIPQKQHLAPRAGFVVGRPEMA